MFSKQDNLLSRIKFNFCLFSAASFSETFYGLKRIAVVDSELKEKLTHKQRVLSFVLLVVLPYLQNKLAQFSLKYQLEEVDSCATRGASIAKRNLSYL